MSKSFTSEQTSDPHTVRGMVVVTILSFMLSLAACDDKERGQPAATEGYADRTAIFQVQQHKGQDVAGCPAYPAHSGVPLARSFVDSANQVSVEVFQNRAVVDVLVACEIKGVMVWGTGQSQPLTAPYNVVKEVIKLTARPLPSELLRYYRTRSN